MLQPTEKNFAYQMEVAVEWGPKSICPHSKEALNVARKPNPSVFCAWNALQIVDSSVLQNRLNLQESNKFEWPGSKETNRTNLLGLWILNISEPFAGMEYTNKIKIRSNKYTIESHYFHWIVTKLTNNAASFRGSTGAPTGPVQLKNVHLLRHHILELDPATGHL